MAERRPEERPVMPPPPPAPAPASRERKASGKITERINRAYATSGPPVPDDEPTTTGQSAQATQPVPVVSSAPTEGSTDATQATQAVPSPTGGAPTPATAGDRFAAAMAAAQQAASSARNAAASTSPADRARTRKARLRVTHVDPWSVMKTSLLLSVAVGIVTVVAVAVIWAVLNAAGVWESIDRAVGEVVGNESSSTFRIEDYVGTRRVLGFTMLVAAVDVVLVTVIATLGAFLYNLAAALLGGIEVVLAEDDR